MTREEQIIKIGAQFAIDETDGQTSGRAASMRGVLLSAFRAGAHWADSHPQWIPVEEEMPPLHYEGANSTDFVLIWDGDDVLIAYYNFKEKKWYNEEYGALIIPATHWMPIVPPRKEEKE